MTQVIDNQVPEGFRKVDLDWSTVPAVDWGVTPEVQGVVMGGRYAQYEKRGNIVVSAIVKLQTEEGPRLLWESYQLQELMSKLRVGDEILVQKTGSVKLGSGNKMHTFDAYMKPGEDRKRRPRALGPRPQPRPLVAPTATPVTHEAQAPTPMEPDFDDDIPF